MPVSAEVKKIAATAKKRSRGSLRLKGFQRRLVRAFAIARIYRRSAARRDAVFPELRRARTQLNTCLSYRVHLTTAPRSSKRSAVSRASHCDAECGTDAWSIDDDQRPKIIRIFPKCCGFGKIRFTEVLRLRNERMFSFFYYTVRSFSKLPSLIAGLPG